MELVIDLKEKSYPIIMLSSATTEGSEITLECLDNGAITFINKPSGSISLDIVKYNKGWLMKLEALLLIKEKKNLI